MHANKRDAIRLPIFVTLTLVLLPLVFAGTYLCVREFYHQTRIALERREILAELGASLVQEKFDAIINLGVSVASQPSVYEHIEKGDWGKTTQNLDSVLQTFPYLDAISILDKDGTMRAVTPPIPGIIGVNFSYRDYYQGVSKSWEPYVSPAFNRSVDPKDALVAVAIPVRSLGSAVAGVIVLTVKVDEVIGWSRGIRVGESGIAYVVDSKGQLVAHPQLNPKEKLTDYSSVPTTQKLLRGEHGVEVVFNPMEKEERLTAYAPVGKYGFGVAIEEPTRIAFADRKENVTELALVWVFIIMVIGVSVFIILKNRAKIKTQFERERSFLESVGDGVAVIDRSWNIVMWGKAAGELTGWSREEVLGKPFKDIMKFIHEHNRKENYAFIEKVFATGKPASLGVGTLMVKKDKSEFPVGDSVAPIFDDRGEISGVIIIFRDATKEQEVMHLRSGFVYASHQLRTPITEALWNLSLVAKEEDSQKRAQSVDIVQNSLLSIQRLSEHLVSASEIDQGNVVVKVSLVKVLDIFGELESSLKRMVDKLGVTLLFGPTPSALAVTTDPKILKKILREVVENALLYSPQGAEVNVNTTTTAKELVFEIVNKGQGIPEEEQSIIFTKFFRASNRPSGVAGSGLGLYLAREYIKELGGKIWFESKEGEQTTFFVSIPLKVGNN